MLLLLLKVGKKNEVLFFFSPPPSFSPLFLGGLVWGCVGHERDYKKGKKEIKEETLSPACSNSFERETFFLDDDDDIY